MEQERTFAREMLLRLLPGSNSGVTWESLWPAVLNNHVISEGALGRIANELRKAEVVSIPAWSSERKQIPDDDYRLSRGPKFPKLT
jgi:hypothetical protein